MAWAVPHRSVSHDVAKMRWTERMEIIDEMPKAGGKFMITT